MISQAVSPRQLILRLILYFAILFGSLFATMLLKPGWLSLMPFGGTDAIEVAGIEIDSDSVIFSREQFRTDGEAAEEVVPTPIQIGQIALFLAFSLAGAILVMLPITWTYIATKREVGYRRTFVRALIVLPVCATTIVLLIQDSLALAFGLAAMVAAVRFRVALEEAIDGIYIFSSICVGLAAGIGYLGIAIMMALFFSLTNAVLWGMNYGQNPIDDANRARKRAKLKDAAA